MWRRLQYSHPSSARTARRVSSNIASFASGCAMRFVRRRAGLAPSLSFPTMWLAIRPFENLAPGRMIALARRRRSPVGAALTELAKTSTRRRVPPSRSTATPSAGSARRQAALIAQRCTRSERVHALDDGCGGGVRETLALADIRDAAAHPGLEQTRAGRVVRARGRGGRAGRDLGEGVVAPHNRDAHLTGRASGDEAPGRAPLAAAGAHAAVGQRERGALPEVAAVLGGTPGRALRVGRADDRALTDRSNVGRGIARDVRVGVRARVVPCGPRVVLASVPCVRRVRVRSRCVAVAPCVRGLDTAPVRVATAPLPVNRRVARLSARLRPAAARESRACNDGNRRETSVHGRQYHRRVRRPQGATVDARRMATTPCGRPGSGRTR